jgi:hypothetical protein
MTLREITISLCLVVVTVLLFSIFLYTPNAKQLAVLGGLFAFYYGTFFFFDRHRRSQSPDQPKD